MAAEAFLFLFLFEKKMVAKVFTLLNKDREKVYHRVNKFTIPSPEPSTTLVYQNER